ncbi:MAG: aldehyde ferredoxin oxidoreductase C-terminal domain-containing protein, partial [Candidatus Caldarchaeum sp.]|nr:aldehyde ferredoxin oxidoreductase C-terminal domain-containing protein [Candidatus Caldarchaeum sp.]
MRVARVFLEDKTTEVQDFDDDLAGGVWGGRMLGAALIGRNSGVKDPLDPQSPLVISVGSLAGTGFPLGNRLTMVFRSPLTKTIAWAHTGGYASYELASLGYSAVYITGRCEKLSTLVISDEGISVVDAEGLAGVGAVETCTMIRTSIGDARVLSIGPAGERKAPLATVINDMGRSSGVRHGAGAVLGSKNIKAVVIRSKMRSAKPPVDKTRFAQLLRRLKKLINDSPLLNIEKGLLAVHGTAIAVEALGEYEALPVKNYTYTSLEEYEKVGGKAMSSSVLVSRLTCSMCPVSCRRETVGYGVRGEGPDYAQVSSLGTNCLILDHEKIAYLTQVCYDAGVDPIEMGNTLAVYADLSERGYVEEPLRWGDFKAMSKLIDQTARLEGLGSVLAQGAYQTAKTFNEEYLAPTVKNISIQNADPRVEHAWGLINAVEPFGGGVHIWVYPNIVKSFEKFGVQTIFDGDPSEEEIAKLVYEKQAEVAALDSLGVCAFSRLSLSPQ